MGKVGYQKGYKLVEGYIARERKAKDCIPPLKCAVLPTIRKSHRTRRGRKKFVQTLRDCSTNVHRGAGSFETKPLRHIAGFPAPNCHPVSLILEKMGNLDKNRGCSRSQGRPVYSPPSARCRFCKATQDVGGCWRSPPRTWCRHSGDKTQFSAHSDMPGLELLVIGGLAGKGGHRAPLSLGGCKPLKLSFSLLLSVTKASQNTVPI